MTTNKEIHEGTLRRPTTYDSLFTDEDIQSVAEVIKAVNKMREVIAHNLTPSATKSLSKDVEEDYAMAQFILFTKIAKEAFNLVYQLGAVVSIEKEELDSNFAEANKSMSEFIMSTVLSTVLGDKDFLEFLENKYKDLK